MEDVALRPASAIDSVASARLADSEAFERLLEKRLKRVPDSNVSAIRKAYDDAVRMYGDQVHWSGERLMTHTLGVCELYLPFDPDDAGMQACLLHHILDTKLWTLDDLNRDYGQDVRSIVSAVHLMSHITTYGRRVSMEDLRLMVLRVSDDMRALLLVLCDFARQLDCLPHMQSDMRRRLCRDVLQLFSPVAARLGMYSLKHRLESRAFPVMYPVDAVRIVEQLEEIQEKHGDFLPEAALLLQESLSDAGIQAKVEGRQKQPYSIFQKMDSKSVTHISQLFDLFALRVIVESDEMCYQTLGVLHRMGHPVAHRFKDYIGFPKPNGYRSLHTTLASLPGVPEGIVVEVQIRTAAMHREADLGIAAHWSYKEGGDASSLVRRVELQQALLQGPSEGARHIPLSDHIFVLTPKGDVIELPEGATPLDFAFNVHTALGLSFKAARANGSIVPINHPLENGDIVEIIRHNEPKPSYNWVSIVKTSSAKSRLKRYFAERDANHTLFVHDKSESTAELPPTKETSNIQLPDSSKFVGIEGNIPMPVRFARCCKPDEGHKAHITGVIGRDSIVRVHRMPCKMIRNVNPERKIGVKWIAGEKAENRKQ